MKRANFNIKDRKILYSILAIVLVSVFTLTIAYAALNAVLTIQGSAQVSSADWDIHFDNVVVTLNSVSGDVPKITSATTSTFSTTLNMPGDFYEFTIDVVNDGSIDAMIENITKTPTLSAAQAKYLKYEITYQNGESITTKQLVEKDSFVRLKVRVEYRSDIISSDLPTSSETLNLGLQLDYTQSDGTGSNVINNGSPTVRLVSGDYDTVGSEICIGTECFYVMSSTTDTVTMLTKYNLYVGNQTSGINLDSSSINVNPLARSTGIQSSIALGSYDDKDYHYDKFPWYGTIAFSEDAYFVENEKLLSQYESTNGDVAYLYDSNSMLYSHVESYKSYLINQGMKVANARIIKVEELWELGCGDLDLCSNAPDWVGSSSYWTGSHYDDNMLFAVYRGGPDDSGFIDVNIASNDFDGAGYHGLRPVIEVLKTDLPPIEN